MRLFRRHQQFKLKAPVTGTHVDLKSIDHTTMDAAQVLLAIKPTTNELHSPVHGEVVAISQHAIKLEDLAGHDYWVHLNQAMDNLNGQLFDWQVRVGDSVSPMTLLGTFNVQAVQQAHQTILVTQVVLNKKAPQREVATGMVMQY
ncbi:PTS glucose transporter subunit IIA [Lactiplantibacillus daowaiensis]|uniref:PTS glucose transporter subunit IIA n=1 Tax=Lactiplantibacillus daowaiensis TaxID=2559918 RepID=A0ABW1S375_9LACO|nr:PTS glucose transporter subunit IIA [Lactiplantibacillus daowaiensis]